MRALIAVLFARLLVLLRSVGPYAAIELLLPGGTLIALLYWWYRNHRQPRREMTVPAVPGISPLSLSA